MVDPVTLALGLASVIPSAVRWLAGDKAGDVADTVITTAKRISGVDDGAGAVAAIHASSELQAQMQREWQAYELDLYRAEIDDRKDARARDVAFVQSGRTNKRADAMVITAFVAVIIIAALLGLGKIDGNTAAGGFLIAVGGMFARNIGTAFDFEFGSSRSSRDKDDVISGIQKRGQ